MKIVGKTNLNRFIHKNIIFLICDLNLWLVVILELGSHPDHNKGPDDAPCACPKTYPIDH